MSNVPGKVSTKFRETFKIEKSILRWFPGHMNKGMRQMEQQLKNVDCVVEVHDARIPFSGRQADYRKTLTDLKPHILVLNKEDLSDMSYERTIISDLKNKGHSHVLFTNFTNQRCKNTRKILPLAKNLILNSNRYNRTTEESYSMMIIGVPNVGKSSLINYMRNLYLQKPNATRVGAIAGITRSVLMRIKISEDPPFYLLDTPGILDPAVKDIHTGLKLALTGCLNDEIVGHVRLADYLLFWLNKNNKHDYVDVLGLSEPNDNVTYVLTFIAAKLKKTIKHKNFSGNLVDLPDFKYAAIHFLTLFRKGRLGNICLDEDIINSSIVR